MRCTPTTPLPSTRALAAELGISRGVVVEAYAQLVAEGFLVARAGAATRVASVAHHDPVEPPEERIAPPVRFDFRTEAADLSAFPRRAWLAALRETLRDVPDASLGYGDRSGAPALRAMLAAYLGRARGVAADPSSVVVCTGITQAITLLARALRRAGVTAWRSRTRAFGAPHGLRARRAAGRPIPVDAGGLVVDGLDHADVGAVLITPRTSTARDGAGAGTPPRRWSSGLRRARRGSSRTTTTASTVTATRSAPLGARARPGDLPRLGVKTLAPALRMGWMVIAPDLLEAVGDAKMLADSGSPQLDQLALARFIEHGELDRHLRRMRVSFRRRRDLMIATLADELPELEVQGIPAGLHVLRRLPAAVAWGRCWRRRGSAASPSSASSTATSRGSCSATPTCPSRRCSRRCASWPSSCAAPVRSGWGCR